MLHSKCASSAMYGVIVVYVYGSLSAFVVTVSSAAASTVVSGLDRAGVAADTDHVYKICLLAAFFLACHLCFGDLQKTKVFTVYIMIARLIAVIFVLMVAIQRSWEVISTQGFKTVAGRIPVWEPSGFGVLFGNCVYLFAFHHILPSLMAPLEHQNQAPCVAASAYGLVWVVIMLLSITALLAFSDQTPGSTCSKKPGGHWCSVQPFYNQNFGPLDWGFGAIGLFILAYPSFAIATIPANAITLRNNLGKFLGAPAPDPNNPWTCSNILLTLAVLTPPFTVAFITHDIQTIVKYVGGYMGITTSYLLPFILIIQGRRVLCLSKQDRKVQWFLKSPFANTLGYIFVFSFYCASFGLVTKQLFFS